MTFSFRSLNVFIIQSINPTLINKKLLPRDFDNWRKFLESEINTIQMELLENIYGAGTEEDKRKFLNVIQKQVVMLSDQLDRYLFRDKKIWSMNTGAGLIKANYLHTLTSLEDFLNYSLVQFPSYYDLQIKSTNFCLRKVVPQLRVMVFEIKSALVDAGIDHILSDIVVKGLNEHISIGKLSPKNIDYFSKVLDGIREILILNDDSLINVLMQMNFNQPEFFLYQIKLISKQLFAANGLHEQQETVLRMRETVRLNLSRRTMSLHADQLTINEEMFQYLTEKSDYLDECMNLRRVAINDKTEAEKSFRMKMNLSVPQLALFFRIQIESGLLAKESLTEVFNFVAHHFYTERTQFISASNLLVRSTNAEFANALKVKDALDSMIRWLDEHYHVNNYQK